MTRTGYQAPRLHIAGQWRAGRHERRHTVVDPATGQPLDELTLADTRDVEEAIAAAQAGFEAWRAVPAYRRSAILHAAAQRLEQRAETVARLLTQEEGKRLAEARQEVLGTVAIIQWFAEEARRGYGRIIPPRVHGSALQVVREPVGPCAAFAPWNFPLTLSSRKVAAALAAGCSVILKAAEETPACVAAMVECFIEADLPPGAMQLIFGVPAEVSQQLLASPVIRKLSFTGSVAVGKSLARMAADQLQRVTLELGGHSPVLVFADANLEQAVQQMTAAKFRNAGQMCASPTRFYVERSVHGEFIARMKAASEALRLGPGLEPDTTLGPLANQRRQEAMQPLVDDALARGARLVTGGAVHGEQGFFYRPTLLDQVPDQATAMTVEPFGPLALCCVFDTEQEAVARANATRMGLAAYLYTDSASRQARVIPQLRTGLVAVNHGSVTAPEAPFGGVGDSGYGSESGIEGLDAYLATKFVHQFPAFDAPREKALP